MKLSKHIRLLLVVSGGILAVSGTASAAELESDYVYRIQCLNFAGMEIVDGIGGFNAPIAEGRFKNWGPLRMPELISSHAAAVLPRNVVMQKIGMDSKKCPGSYLYIFERQQLNQLISCASASVERIQDPVSTKQLLKGLGLKGQEADCSLVVDPAEMNILLDQSYAGS